MKKNTNKLSIVGFILSFFTTIISFIICTVALGQIDDETEKGRGLARAGIIINIIKILIIILCFILLANHTYDNIDGGYKCKKATNCEYDATNGLYNCTYDKNGVEEYIICNPEDLKIKITTTQPSFEEEDDDSIDTFDYDREY